MLKVSGSLSQRLRNAGCFGFSEALLAMLVAVGGTVASPWALAETGPAESTPVSVKPGPLSTLKHVQVSEAGKVDLVFDHPVQAKQIRTEFFNDIVQLSITDAAVYPAKITSVAGDSLAKVFAYQYAPRLVRVRFTVKGKAENFQNKFRLKNQGKSLLVQVGQPPAAAPAPVAATVKAAVPMSHEERSLLDRIVRSAGAPERAKTVDVAGEAAGSVKDTASSAPKANPETSEAVKAPEKKTEPTETTKTVRALTGPASAGGAPRLGGAKPLPSPWRSLGALLAVVGLFGLVAVGMKRFRRGRAGRGDSSITRSKGGLMSFLRQFTGDEQDPLIEVLATQSLGPKQSLTVVRVGDRQLVLGSAGESMRLITEMPYSGKASVESSLRSNKTAMANARQSAPGFDFAEELERLSRESDEGPAFLNSDPSPNFSREAITRAATAAAGAARSAAPAGPGVSGASSGYRTGAGAYVGGPAVATAPRSGSSGMAGSSGSAGASVASSALPPKTNGDAARSRIRSRLEGLKQL